MRRRSAFVRGLCGALLLGGVVVAAQGQMPDPKNMSGIPRPDPSIPAGTVTVRVIRGTFANNIAGQPVELLVDGRSERLRTGDDGRVQRAGLAAGTTVRAVTEVAGERLESQDATMGTTGVAILLVATDSDAAAREIEARKLAEGPAVEGVVVMGPESRIVLEMQEDRLNVFYILQILNTARTPVDIGGPLIFDLPREARGAGVMEGSTPQATTQGPRLIVTGPFAPGATPVQLGFQLPYSGDTARLEQRWPAALPQLTVLMAQLGGFDLVSPQIQSKRAVSDQGQALLLAQGPAIGVGGTLGLDITGLPHHPTWPRNIALTLAGLAVCAGLFGAFAPRRRAA